MNTHLNLAWVIAASVVLYVIATHLEWLYQRHPDGRLADAFRRRLHPRPLFLALYQLIRFAYYIGLPYLTIRHGLTPARMMGIDAWGTLDNISIAIGLAGVAFLLLCLAWRGFSRALQTSFSPSPPTTAWDSRQDGVSATIDTIYLQVHWAFYRSGPILWLGGDYYTGSFLGLLLVILEWTGNPHIRTGLLAPLGSACILTRGANVLWLTVAFFFARNLWLLLALHWLVDTGTRLFRRRLAGKQSTSHRLPSEGT